MKEKSKYLILPGILSFILLWTGLAYVSLTFLLFVALLPVFYSFSTCLKKGWPFHQFAIVTLLSHLAAYTLVNFLLAGEISWVHAAAHGVLMGSAFLFYWLTITSAPNRIGTFTLVIYWVALEYISLTQLHTPLALMLGSHLLPFEGISGWSENTGILSLSFWIVAGNALLSVPLLAMIRNRTLHLPSLLVTLLLISLPAAASLIFTYNTGEDNAGAYEFFGRTALWVSILLVIYGLAKRISRR